MGKQVAFEVTKELEAFIIQEAKYADEGQYQAWYELWAEDAVYWVPRKDGDDPAKKASHLYDNYSRLTTRVKQLNTGNRFSQVPISGMRRVISNYEFFNDNDDKFRVEANFYLPEYSIQSVHSFRIWSGRYTYILSRKGDSFQIHLKKVNLVNGLEPIPTLSFLI
ncbi:Small subunit of phenylpropionate dioxygenase [Cycloclasticus zancles 78-ME]|jgi:benzoate/toluate 1,2-dioxygenase beta subunit|uniref:Small subunit of phenylpropionate dioxygenase n=2 Tax=Cycloclasticus TaxID=34067 RepID=S5T451_9GAMM|nr:Small subunit of phenylpropionate dioxygenase [Cycloclasticus zancles 78-ME]ATI02243.1 aromatic-ring-hydroxylating dioxygenase subunit alpha [Cycloclasticus sp. PY97N]EPD12507.1 aromatic-ring-hydroxylating dioxygenase subunit beta [Cycloclasticus pugetii]SHI77615.1 3-phenylpropionate/cinnamic acid dioxygenase, small subunit [Cycloclasticus pugetii]|tara:strand:+ start:55 stop:549 length:495 start_codon:yes stop_codon:yes gene_type:complete